MANYTLANLVKAQTMVTDMFQKAELRFRDPITYKKLLGWGPVFFPDYNSLLTREDRAIEVNYTERTSRALGAARAHNHAGTKGDSGIITPAWSTKTDKFYYSLKQADISVYSLEQQLMNEVKNIVANFANGLETVAAAYLFNQRSQVNAVTIKGSFNGVNNTYEIVKATDGKQAMQITESVMDALEYQGLGYTIFCNSIAWADFKFAAAQGAQNSENLSFQYQGYEFVKTLGFDAYAAALGYTEAFWIVVPTGMVGAMPWIPRQNREGNSNFWPLARYGSFVNPVDGVTYAVHEFAAGADESANNGYTQDVKVEVEYSVDIAIEHAPLSTANDAPIQAFALV